MPDYWKRRGITYMFQNVIDNALKYSMPGTRIYLSAEQAEGDKSRHSEGNGLGLSIAKSFTELCGGAFEVKLDDDLFKVIIILR